MMDDDLPPPPPPPESQMPPALPPAAASTRPPPLPASTSGSFPPPIPAATPSPPPPPAAAAASSASPPPATSTGPPPSPVRIPIMITPATSSSSPNIGPVSRTLFANGGPPPLPPSSASSSPASTTSTISNGSSATSPKGTGVTHLAAMLQASMLKTTSQGPPAPATGTSTGSSSAADSDSDDEGAGGAALAPPRPSAYVKKLSTTSASSSSFTSGNTCMKWEVDKANRYGLKESRVLLLDLAAHAVRFFDKDKLKAEIPLNQISAAARRPNGDEPKRVEMQFKEDRRSYDLYFKNEEEAAEFERQLSSEIDTNAAPGTRAYSQSMARNMVPIGASSPSHHSHVSVSSLSPSSIHHTSSGYVSNSLSMPARDASESIAIHSEMGGAYMSANRAAPPAAVENHNAYLDYAVSKKNRFGIKQNRILVINSTGATMLLLDEKRKFKKEFALDVIMSVEIPKTEKGKATEAQCYIVFAKESGQKPFHLFFADTLDRLHFCERLVSLAPHGLSIKDESDNVEDEDSFRFGILKINKVGVKKKRIVVLRTKERVLRSFNREKSYKDVGFDKIIKMEKPVIDRFRLNVWLVERPHPLILIFPDPIARERFVSQSNYIKQLMEEDDMIAIAPSAAEQAASAAAVAAGQTPPAPMILSAKPLSIFVGTWNLGNAPFTYESLNDFIPSMKYDLYVIGLQECSKGHRDQWLMELRNHIQQNWKSSSSGSTTSIEDDKDDSEQPYALLGVVKLWEIVMMVLIRRPLASKVTNLCMDTVATGVGDVLGNKGGCGISFSYQDTNLCFVACHLAARSERIVQRAENYMKILKQLQLGLPNVDILCQMDHVFWLGDLNYRNELEFSEVLQLVKMKDWKLLTTYDQLLSQMSKQLVFAGFQEGLVRFAPTYRWERKENVFSNKKFQAPSWTDRVLWHSLPGLADLKLDTYSSAPNVMGSDHRPVFATFTLESRMPYTAKFTKQARLQSIKLAQNENPHLFRPDNAAFDAKPPQGEPNLPKASSLLPPPLSPGKSGSVPPPIPSSVPVTSNILSVPGTNANYPLNHSLSVASGSIVGRPSAAPSPGQGGTTPSAKVQFTPYVFTAPASGPAFAPPAFNPQMLSQRPPLLGSTKDFTIVLQQVKCTFSTIPRGDFTLTCSAPFLNTWPTTAPVSYPFGLEVGSHWDEIVLPPFIHDLYYLYTRHIMFSISVPSMPANSNGVNVEQTGLGTCIGTVIISLGTICANILNAVAALKPTVIPPALPRGAAMGGMLPFNPLAPPPAAAQPQVKFVNPNSPGFNGDHGAYYFIEPIYREGLYAGQMEGRILFRYK